MRHLPYGSGGHTGPNKPDKGLFEGSCNVTACQRPGATWFNHGTRAYYCVHCAHHLNTDKFVYADAMRLFGHVICTEGKQS